MRTLDVVITAHLEGSLLATTLQSAAEAAGAVGEPCGLIVILDNSDEHTISVAEKFSMHQVWITIQLVRAENGEAGMSRRQGIQISTAEYVAVLDGDDLVSQNYFVDSIQALRREQCDVAHPEWVISFGARDTVSQALSLSDNPDGYLSLIEHNAWPSSLVAKRSLLLNHPHASLPPSGGYGPEDWFWNIDTAAKGIIHFPVRDTAYFYRVKQGAGVNSQHNFSILPKIPLAALRARYPNTRLSHDVDPYSEFEPREIPWPRKIVKSMYYKVWPVFRWLTIWLNPAFISAINKMLANLYRSLFRIEHKETRYEISLRPIRKHFHQAAEIEPALSAFLERIKHAHHWSFEATPYASILDRILTELDGCSAIVAVPWIGIGGADSVALNYIKALSEFPDFADKKTAVLTFHDPLKTDKNLIPDNVRLIQLPRKWRALPPDVMSRLVASIVIQSRPKIILAINGFDVIDAMKQFGRQMTDGTRIFATLFSWDRTKHGFPSSPITDSAQRDHLNFLEGIITDNPVSGSLIHQRLALPPEKVFIHLQPALHEIPPKPELQSYAEHFSAAHPFRIIWPHRIDTEKRPDSLIRIAEAAKNRGLPVSFDVWGSAVLNDNSESTLNAMKRAGINYCGPYSGGLRAIPNLKKYQALLLTSQNEGLPLVLVQAQLLGIPIIASAVGGVPFIVKDMETGILSEGPEDIEGFIRAIELLLSDEKLRTTLIESAYDSAVANHSWESFNKQVNADIFRLA